MKRVIITGPTGTIGIALIDLLIKKGCEVYAVCRPHSSNIENLKKHDNLYIIECDISELLSLSGKLKGKFDAFYHLAWNGTFGSLRNAINLQINNVKYTLDAVKLAHDLGCGTFIGAGSQAEYGYFNKPADEYTPTKPFTPYGAAKLSAGHMSRVYANSLGIRHIWFRIFSVFGPYDDNRTLISYVINELKNNRAPILTPGEQIWDYLYSYDAADAMIKAVEKGKNNAIYCLGSGDNKLLKDYIYDIAAIVNPNVKLIFGQKPYDENQIMFLSADISRLKNDTGFLPRYNFTQAITEIVNTQ